MIKSSKTYITEYLYLQCDRKIHLYEKHVKQGITSRWQAFHAMTPVEDPCEMETLSLNRDMNSTQPP